ncbi:unnamed protein product [Lasius platythorax]|uniref:Uncharacterized protein n=1 Tax=Lasius platythorax TaxID=488582 RepID=A0AAV2NAS0_9HYME
MASCSGAPQTTPLTNRLSTGWRSQLRNDLEEPACLPGNRHEDAIPNGRCRPKCSMVPRSNIVHRDNCTSTTPIDNVYYYRQLMKAPTNFLVSKRCFQIY